MSNNKIIKLPLNKTMKGDLKKTMGSERESSRDFVIEQSIEVKFNAIHGGGDILKSTLKVSMKN